MKVDGSASKLVAVKKIILLSLAVVLAAALIAAFLIGKSIPSTTQRVSFSAPGVSDDGRGVLVGFTVSLRPGSGRVFVDIRNTFYQSDVENSIRKALRVASRELRFNANAFDVEFRASAGERLVSGESAGALFTTAIAAAFLGKQLRKDATVSATVLENGDLGPVEAIEEKAFSAAEAGVKYFIVASEQEIRNPEEIAARITIVRASHVREVIQAMLE